MSAWDELIGKKLMVLGATEETSNLVRRAEALGVETHVVDPFPHAPAKRYSAHPVDIDCFDIDALEAYVVQEGIDGVLPGCADVLVPAYLTLCERTGLACYVNPSIVSAFNNKRGLKNALRSVGLPTIPEFTIDQVRTESFAQYPVFVKPVDNNSSKGMSVVYGRDGLGAALDEAFSHSRSQELLIEEVMDCDDFNIGYVLMGGEVAVTFTADRYVNASQKGVGSITAGMVYPSRHASLYFDTAHQKVLDLFESLGFRDGIISIQAFVRDGEVMFYDPALRITGGQEYILSEFFYGLDVLGLLVHFALTGRMPEEHSASICDPSFAGSYACNLAFSVRGGVIDRVEGIEEARKLPYVLNVTQEHGPGDVIDRIGTAQQNIARLHLFASDKQMLTKEIIELQHLIVAYDKSGENMMLEGMNPNGI